MALRKFTKSSSGEKMWKSMSSSVKRRPQQEWCAFYTPAGRMVSKPAGKRPRHMHPEEWCAAKTPAWQRKAGKSKSGGLNKKGVASYRKANPGSKLQTAVTTKPSKLKKGSKAAKRRKSFCARMKGMKKKLTSTKKARDPNSRINKSLRKWNCN